MSNAFDAMLQKLQATSSGGGNLEYFKAPRQSTATEAGEYLRVATPSYVEPNTPPFFQVMLYDLKALLGVNRTIVAPAYFGAPDPIAEFIEENTGTKDAEIAAVVDSLTPKMKWGCLGATRSHPGKITVWSGMPKTPLITMLAVANKAKAKDAEYNWPFSLKDGHDFEILLYGPKSGIPKYQINTSPRPKPVEGWEELQDKIDNFDIWSKILYIETKETLQGILEGRYDKDGAKAARAARDERFGRPYPEAPYNFMSNWGDESPTVETAKGQGLSKAVAKAQGKDEVDELPYTDSPKTAAGNAIQTKMQEMRERAAAKKAGK